MSAEDDTHQERLRWIRNGGASSIGTHDPDYDYAKYWVKEPEPQKSYEPSPYSVFGNNDNVYIPGADYDNAEISGKDYSFPKYSSAAFVGLIFVAAIFGGGKEGFEYLGDVISGVFNTVVPFAGLAIGTAAGYYGGKFVVRKAVKAINAGIVKKIKKQIFNKMKQEHGYKDISPELSLLLKSEVKNYDKHKKDLRKNENKLKKALLSLYKEDPKQEDFSGIFGGMLKDYRQKKQIRNRIRSIELQKDAFIIKNCIKAFSQNCADISGAYVKNAENRFEALTKTAPRKGSIFVRPYTNMYNNLLSDIKKHAVFQLETVIADNAFLKEKNSKEAQSLIICPDEVLKEQQKLKTYYEHLKSEGSVLVNDCKLSVEEALKPVSTQEADNRYKAVITEFRAEIDKIIGVGNETTPASDTELKLPHNEENHHVHSIDIDKECSSGNNIAVNIGSDKSHSDENKQNITAAPKKDPFAEVDNLLASFDNRKNTNKPVGPTAP